MILGYAIIAVPTGIVSVELAKTGRAVSRQACPDLRRRGTRRRRDSLQVLRCRPLTGGRRSRCLCVAPACRPRHAVFLLPK